MIATRSAFQTAVRRNASLTLIIPVLVKRRLPDGYHRRGAFSTLALTALREPQTVIAAGASPSLGSPARNQALQDERGETQANRLRRTFGFWMKPAVSPVTHPDDRVRDQARILD